MQQNATDIGKTPTHEAAYPVPQEWDEPADADQLPADDEPVALTHKQITALPFIISAPTLAEGARRAGLARSTIHRWMGDDHFRARFERLRDEALSLAQAEMKGVALKGAMVLAEMLDDPSSDIRLRAAQTAVYAGFKVEEQSDIKKRIDRVSEALDLQRSRKPRF